MTRHLTIPPWFTEFVLRRQLWILAIVVCSGLTGIFIAAGTPFRTSLIHSFMPDEREYQNYKQRVSSLGGTTDDVILLATREGGELFSPRTLDSIRAASRQMQSLPEIEAVQTFVDAPWLAPNGRLSVREIAARTRVRGLILQGKTLESGGFNSCSIGPMTNGDNLA